MNTSKLERRQLSQFGLALLDQMEPNDDRINTWKRRLADYQFGPSYSDDDYSWLTCVLALKAVNSGNYGVGSVLADQTGKVVSWGHNEMFYPYFRSDRHAEMVVVDKFEDVSQDVSRLEGHTLFTSLESCPMCLARLILSRIDKVAYVTEDAASGIIHKLDLLPPSWIDLSAFQVFAKADCSPELRGASTQIFLINSEKLNEALRRR